MPLATCQCKLIELGTVYRLLSACFCLPEKKLFCEEGLTENLASLLARVCTMAEPPARAMARAFEASSQEDLRIEYARLFVGPGKLLAPPFGSIYLDMGARVMGDTTLAVARMYEEAGLSLETRVKQPPDHISIELEFMYYLIHKTAGAQEDGDVEAAAAWQERQAVFFNEHLSLWAGEFAERVTKGSENDFYTSLADCLATFLKYCGMPGKPQ